VLRLLVPLPTRILLLPLLLWLRSLLQISSLRLRSLLLISSLRLRSLLLISARLLIRSLPLRRRSMHSIPRPRRARMLRRLVLVLLLMRSLHQSSRRSIRRPRTPRRPARVLRLLISLPLLVQLPRTATHARNRILRPHPPRLRVRGVQRWALAQIRASSTSVSLLAYQYTARMLTPRMRGVQRRWRRARTNPRTREVACQRADGGVSNGRVVVGLLLDGYLLLLYRLLLDLSLHRRLLVVNGLLLDLSLHRRWLLVRHHRRSLVLKRIRRRRHIFRLRLLAPLLFRPRLELRLRLPREAVGLCFFLYRPRRLFLRCEVGSRCGSACSHCTSVSQANGSGRRICRSRRRVSRSRSGGRGRRRCRRRRALILVLRPRAPVVL
jgi:hypothetical protein